MQDTSISSNASDPHYGSARGSKGFLGKDDSSDFQDALDGEQAPSVFPPELVNHWQAEDEEINFGSLSKEEMIRYMDQKFADANEREKEEGWVLRKRTPLSVVWCNWNCSKFFKAAPQMKTLYRFPNNTAHEILQCLNDVELRPKWDDSIDYQHLLPEYTTDNQVVIRIVNKTVLKFSQREFIDKKTYYETEKGDIYMQVTACPDELWPMDKKFTRSYSIIGMNRIRHIGPVPGKGTSSTSAAAGEKVQDQLNPIPESEGDHLSCGSGEDGGQQDFGSLAEESKKDEKEAPKGDDEEQTTGCVLEAIVQTDCKVNYWGVKLLSQIFGYTMVNWGHKLRSFAEEHFNSP